MKYTRFLAISLVACAAVVMLYDASYSKPYRDNLPIPSVDILDKLLAYSKKSRFDKLKKSVVFLKPLIENLEENFRIELYTDINVAADAKDKKTSSKLIQKLIYYDIKDLFEEGMEDIRTAPDKARKRFKTAYLDFLIISPWVEKADFSSYNKIKRAFRNVSFLIDNQNSLSPYQREKELTVHLSEINKIVEAIENELVTVLPYLK